MSGSQSESGAWLRELRLAFDQTFARVAAARPPDPEILLAIRIAERPHSLRLSQLAGLLADRVITAVPTAERSFLGVIGLRGSIIPVYSLSGLLGYPGSAEPRWMALAGRQEQVGFAFDAYEGHLQPAAAELLPPGDATAPSPHVHGVVRCGSTIRPLLDLDSLLNRIPRRPPDRGASRSPRSNRP